MSTTKRVTVNFDLDGVLARFTDGACKLHGKPVEQPTEWDFHHAWGITDQELYAGMGRDFWAELGRWEDGFDLLARTEEYVGRENILFLSSPVRTPGCEEGKRAWFAKHLPRYDPWSDLMLGGAKHKVAHPGSVLVDDSDSNVNKFRNAGGYVHTPARLWNAWGHTCVGPCSTFDVEEEWLALKITIDAVRDQ